MITLANIRRAIYNIGKRLDIVDKEQDIIKGRQDNTYNKGEVDLLLSNKANNSINELIPAQASSDNLLADKDFVNSSISTATATYRGCYNLVNDLSLTTQASHGLIETALATAISGTPDNNDYAFVLIPADDLTPTEIFSVERYKFNGTLWSFEYTLNNSGFTAAQWAAVNSNITSGLVTKLNALSTNPQSSIASLFGMDSNGNFLNISAGDLTSILGGNLGIARWSFSNLNINELVTFRTPSQTGFMFIWVSTNTYAGRLVYFDYSTSIQDIFKSGEYITISKPSNDNIFTISQSNHNSATLTVAVIH